MKKIVSIIMLIILLSFNISNANSYLMHTINPNDSYYIIANQYNETIHNLQTINNNPEETIIAGTLMKIRPINNITICINGNKINTEVSPYIENSRTFVPIRTIAEALNVDKIDWDNKNQTAIIVNKDSEIRLPIGSNFAIINDNYVNLDAPINIYSGRTFVPIRFIAENFNCTVNWDSNNYIVNITYNRNTKISDQLTTNNTSNSTYEHDLYWLSRIVEAEAGAEPFEGKLAVANVVINRKNNSDFPNTIKKVIFDTNYGIQYTPVLNGTIYNNPSLESINAAKQALAGNNNIGSCMYFLNPNTSQNFWIIYNRTFYKQIQSHYFYL